MASTSDTNPSKRQRIESLDLKTQNQKVDDSNNITDDQVCEGDEGEEEEIKPKTIDDIFDELLQHVFSYCGAEEVLGNFSKVCLRWKRVACDPRTLSHCQLVLDGEREVACIDVLRSSQYLDNVFILPGHSKNALKALMEGPLVHGLIITVLLPCLDTSVLLSHNKEYLKRLSMIVDDELLAQSNIQFTIAGMPRLTYLHFASENESFVTCPDLGLSQLEQFPPLRTVRLEQLPFDGTKSTFIRTLLTFCKDTIKSLSLSCKRLEDAQSFIKAGTFETSRIEKISVSSGCLSVISHMPCLTSLHIVGCDCMSESSSYSWISKLSMISNLKILILENTHEPHIGQGDDVGSEKCGIESHIISKCNRLESFLGIDGSLKVDTFNIILKNNHTLKEFQLFDFSGFEDPNQIKIIKTENPNLKYINVSMTYISDVMLSALQELESQTPNLSIDYPDPELY